MRQPRTNGAGCGPPLDGQPASELDEEEKRTRRFRLAWIRALVGVAWRADAVKAEAKAELGPSMLRRATGAP
jgi:hypothetical protein